MLVTYRVLLALHVLMAVAAVGTFWVAGAMKKGSPRHIRVGRLYVLAMVAMCVSALGLSALNIAVPAAVHSLEALRTKERDEALARQRAAEAQLAALEARVQPHFFFNALNSIAAMIPEDAEGAERMVERMIERMSALMRSSLQHDGPPTSPLEDELRLVRDYLEVERVRFRDRLRYELRIESRTGATAAVIEVPAS